MALCACICQMQLESPARQSNHFSTCIGNMGTYVKKIRWQFLVSMGRWQLHSAKRQNRDYPGAEPLFELFDVGSRGKVLCLRRNGMEDLPDPIRGKATYNWQGWAICENIQLKKTEKKKKEIVLMEEQTSPSTWHLIVLQILARQTYIKTCMYACRYPCPHTHISLYCSHV